VVFVDADAIEAEFGGEFEEVEVVVVDAMAFDGVVEAGIDVDPDAAVLLPEVIRQVGIGHEVEPVELHAAPPVPRCFAGG
jgi:hypothetical protein